MSRAVVSFIVIIVFAALFGGAYWSFVAQAKPPGGGHGMPPGFATPVEVAEVTVQPAKKTVFAVGVITDASQLLDAIGTVQQFLSLLLGGIASISLVVGGIGIMNIMLVSVRERTREIGIRRAIGAQQSQILTQFLIEAIVLSLVGGIIGVIIGEVVAYFLAQLGQWNFALSPTMILASLGFSMFVGVVFGVWPARTASKLKPVEALRFE